MLTSGFELVGSSPKFKKALEFADNVSVTKTPALVVGEHGTGKRTLCRFIHNASSRRNGPFNVVDCSSDPKKVENEILGYREADGKFVRGVLERSNSGTVVFANIDGIDEVFQKRLITIIQELTDYDLDIRILATTTKNLSKYVGAGRFHRSLYMYFANTQISLSPLRERTGDIYELANYYLSKFAGENGIETLNFSNEAIDKLASHYWANNISELRSVIESAALTAEESVVDASAIEFGEKRVESASYEESEDGIRLMSLKEAEKLLIKKALVHTSENRTQAAKILGVSIRTLRNKINEYRHDGNSYFVNLR
ncbi:MAG: sigma-54-dependent Fis family transcriptional regulator [Bacteriovoracaceae bacterium]|nr:sigma-54-dependent Fis family transcriptional regulator [Bacteriovoracaceae bacterium]